MPAITLEPIQTCSTRNQSYRVKRGATIYYVVDDLVIGSVCVYQVYVSRHRRRERRLPEGKVRGEILAAITAYKATT